MKHHKCRWTVEISVADVWIADGFKVDQDVLHEKISELLPFATPEEIAVEVRRAPDSIDIQEACDRQEESIRG